MTRRIKAGVGQPVAQLSRSPSLRRVDEWAWDAGSRESLPWSVVIGVVSSIFVLALFSFNIAMPHNRDYLT